MPGAEGDFCSNGEEQPGDAHDGVEALPMID
jgi:hypothetical protein